ncbi:unnamed protein product [Prorocentrum cordatum]|uniref:Condensation domain-containing protein n=1 Tax=Prorocentrum cordatum TaxID=2364126 RepID=A0ABN9PZ57_9DINO|nr:unnamed protein product [Polarella glacialis]
MWNSKCQWTLRRDRPLEEAALRAALARLIDRHPALRVRLADPMRLFDATQKAFSVFELWRAQRRRARRSAPTPRGPLQRLTAALSDAALGAVQWSFRRAWPRVASVPPRIVCPCM